MSRKSLFWTAMIGLLLGASALSLAHERAGRISAGNIGIGMVHNSPSSNFGWNREGLFACDSDELGDDFCLAYNRVDGFFFGIKRPRELYRRHGILQLYGMVGFATESRRFQYHAALERSFFPAYRQFAIGGEMYDVTFSEDRWIIPSWENSLASFLIHEDFQDFYRRLGMGVYVSQQITRKALLKVGYYEEKHRSLTLKTDWALFGGHKSFRPNPPVAELNLRGIIGQFVIDTRDHWRYGRRGWYLNASAEYFPAEFEGDGDFKRYIVDLRRYQPISRGENLAIRLRVGESEGILPVQKWFDLGGIGTLRGFDYKAFTGDRMVLANIEYHINWDRLDWNPDIPIISDFNLILFADAGKAWFREELDFSELDYTDLHSDVGIALADDDGSFRLNIAKRLDRSVDAIRVTFRISHPF